MDTLLLAHTTATLYMVGVIWLVQLVQYPGFSAVPAAAFTAYHADHVRRISWVVMPAMLLELVTALWLLVEGPEALRGWFIGGAVLLALIWLSTFLLQVPAHNRLGAGFDPGVQRRLVHTNWLRTAGWSLRGLVALQVLRLSGGGVA